jgi:hypothetical protein
MAYAIKAICNEKGLKKNGFGTVYIQYCFSASKRTLLNTGIAIPPKYWHKKRCLINDTLPEQIGNADALNDEITRQLRLAEDLLKSGIRAGVKDLIRYMKEKYSPELQIRASNAYAFTMNSQQKTINYATIN